MDDPHRLMLMLGFCTGRSSGISDACEVLEQACRDLEYGPERRTVLALYAKIADLLLQQRQAWEQHDATREVTRKRAEALTGLRERTRLYNLIYHVTQGQPIPLPPITGRSPWPA